MRTMKWGWLIASAMSVVGLATIACSEDTTSSPTSADAGGDTSQSEAASIADAESDAGACATLSGSYGSAICNKCMQRSCCAQISACEADPGCKAMQACVFACIQSVDAGGCYQTCVSQHKAAQSLWKEVDRCTFSDPPGCGLDCTN